MTWVLLVAVVYALAQLLLLDTHRYLSWDEAVYTSQVSRFADAANMGAHRARGLTLIVAPVVLLTDSMPPLRVYLAAFSSAALFGAFAVWCRSIEWGAPIAAGLFASSWVTIYYGSAVYPNLYSALISMAAIGVAIRAVKSERKADLYLLGALVAVGVLMRPTEAVIVGVCVVIVALTVASGRRLALVTAALGGFAVGAIPWVIEAWLRFDGPLRRFETVRDAVGTGPHNNLMEYLRSLDTSADGIGGWALLWLVLLLVLGLAGLFRGDAGMRRISATAIAAAFLFAAPYVFATEPTAQRYMLPGYALLCVGSALGVLTIVAKLDNHVLAVVSVALIVLLATAWNFQTLRTWDDRQVGNADTALVLGQSLRVASGSSECFFLSPFSYPAIAFASGCSGGPLGDDVADNRRRFAVAETEAKLFALTPTSDVSAVLGDGWRCDPVAGLADRGWQICTRTG